MTSRVVPGIRRYDRRLPPRQPVQQRRFTSIRRPGDGDDQPLPQALSSAIRERFTNLTAQLLRSIKRRANQIFRHISLVGKVDTRLNQRQSLDNLPPPSLRPVADQALELTERVTALRWRFRRDQVRQTLHLREVKPAILERPARELPRFGQPAVVDRAQSIQHGSDHRVTAMQLQLCHILTGLAAGTRKPKCNRLVDHLAASRLAHTRKRRLPWLRHTPDQPLKRDGCLRAAHPDHSDCSRRPARGEGKDGGTIAPHKHLVDRMRDADKSTVTGYPLSP